MQHFPDHCRRLSGYLEHTTETLGRMASWLTLLMVVVMFAVVMLRYAFGLGWIAMQESVIYMHGILIMLGMAYTLGHDAHVRVDIFYQRMSVRARAAVDLLGSLLLLLPVALFTAWISWPYVADAWSIRESSFQTGGLPGVYLLKSMILVMAGTLILQASAIIIRQILQLTVVEQTDRTAE